MSKVVLVTGTSTGLGISIAVQAAKLGHTVYATMRDLGKRQLLDEAADSASVALNVRQLDVQDSSSVETMMEEIIKTHGAVDTLINNAGAGFVRSTEQATEADIERIMDINFMGVVRCTKAALPAMRENRRGHIINITSVGGLVGQPFNEIYCAAKFAVEGYTEAMASYLTPSFNINFTAIEPGGIATEFANNVMKQVEETGGMLQDDYLPILQKYIGGAQNRPDADELYQTADEVASVVIGAMESETPPIRARTSKWADSFTKYKTASDPEGRLQQAAVIEQFLS